MMASIDGGNQAIETELVRSEASLVLAPVGAEYRGPVVVTSILLGGRTISLVSPADPDQLLDDPLVINLDRQDDYTPYWAYL